METSKGATIAGRAPAQDRERTRPRASADQPAGAARRVGAKRRGRLSVRRNIQIVMLALIALGVLQTLLQQAAIGRAAYMLHREETSYRQLDEYQRLSIGLLEWIKLDRRHEDDSAERNLVERSLRRLDDLTAFEVEIVQAAGGGEANLSERSRLQQIRSVVAAMLADSDRLAAAAAYQSRLKPLLDSAIGKEKAEAVEVERQMDELKRRMSWLAGAGLAVEIATIALILGFVARTVLDPMRRIVSDIGELGRGRFAHRIVVARRDEFGLLALHFNRMARRLERGRQKLMVVNDGLEATVAERTRALQARNEELRQVDESRRRFFADVSHELRTPLTSIVGEADIALRDEEADVVACREALSSILANSTYLNRRIDDLMALARSTDGRLELHLQDIDLNVVAAEAMTEVRSLAKVNGVATRFTPLSMPLLVRGDRLRLRQCLMILLDNAVKFSRARQAVDVEVAENDGTAALTVVNRGHAIAADELPAIFERFYQTAVGRRKGGTGLGLAIARRIVEAHAGAIVATSRSPGETAVTITLPLTRDASA